MTKTAVHALLEDPRVWRAGRRDARWPVLSSGHPQLDAWLPGGGWPAGRLTEFAVERWGSGELALLMPLLARLSSGSADRSGRWIAWIAPPFLPYAPALAAAGLELAQQLLVRPAHDDETLWAAEQALRSGSCAVVLAWVRHAAGTCLRRLQLAAEAGDTPLLLFRPPAALATPSPASLRLSIEAAAQGASLRLHKHQGGATGTLPLAALQPR
ncbi:translesion DNA synthesis-associated protein ImuA [Thioalkalivibrio sp. XN279]|uniref:translesion DNA synthesis-associated protein ImuA n=1 Tax=Thioalkalivibrio sp. XN279 TaxID=2714953 RepID=UPI00140D39C5|nr:translesion DNA synthesis-associated protein ImuA [Thioalkalivibrio sp. XN279]NHA14308.1 translesion DNA synthesis-associated protein ImuA [Thioalkalivibrio sp. XN279]